MELHDLIGKNFKYISKYDRKESAWTGTVKSYVIVQECSSDWLTFIPVIKIRSEAGPVYDLNELRFFSNKQDTHLSTETKLIIL